MTEKELKKKISNEETIFILDRFNRIKRLKLNKNFLIDSIYKECSYCNEYIFDTELEAKHYKEHCDVIKIDRLPFVSWKNFKRKNQIITFQDDKYNKFYLMKMDDKILLKSSNHDITLDLNEENFYNLYDVCKRLYLGEKEVMNV